MCNFSKVLEMILYCDIYNSTKHMISPYQHGFQQKKSTITNLTSFSQYVCEILDNRGQCDVIYTDFTKACDQIDHLILVEKLNRLGFSNSLIKLFQSYLHEREHVVKYRNFISKSFFPSSGVPQGSNLGPLLFLLFINDLADVAGCKKLMFADDFQLYTEIESIEEPSCNFAYIFCILGVNKTDSC